MLHPTNDLTAKKQKANLAKRRLLMWRHSDPDERHSTIATFFEVCAGEYFELRGLQHELVIRGHQMSAEQKAAIELASRDAERKIREASVFVFGYDIFDPDALATLPPKSSQLG